MRNRVIFICFLICAIAVMLLYQQSQKSYHEGYGEYFRPAKQLTEEEKQWLIGQERLVFGANSHFAPLGFEDKNYYKGFFADFIGEVSKKLGKQVEIQFFENEKEIEKHLYEGKIDFAIMTHSLEREAYAKFTFPIIKARGVLCSRKKDHLENINNLNGETIVIIHEEQKIPKSGKQRSIQYMMAGNYSKAIDLVEINAADAIIGEETVISYYLKEKQIFDSYYLSPVPVYEKNYVFGVSDQNEKLWSILNKTVQNIALEGYIGSLQLKWFGFSSSLVHENISDRIAIMVFIMFAAAAILFYYFYESNKSLYSELEKRMEQLTISKNDLQTTFDGVSYLMIELDRDYQILNVNKAFSQKLEVHKRNAIGKKLFEVLKINNNIKKIVDSVIRATFDVEKEGKTEINYDGRIFEMSTFPLKDARDRVTKILIMLNDVSRAKAAERQMLQDNKMIAVGQLAAGVAHEIRNPLGLIRNYSYILKNDGINNEEIRNKALDVIEKSVEKSGNIINNLLNFSRISSNKWEEVILCDFLSSITSLENDLLKTSNIHVSLDCQSSIKLYTITESLEIIIVNLISNAVDAMNDGGEIRISCYAERDIIFFKFQDTGKGIPKEIIDNIFNPFFTTKKSGEGTGLGLYIVYSEVQKLRGDIQVESEINKGTCFTMTLPNQKGDENEE